MPNVLYFNFVFDPQGTRPEDFKVTMTDSTKTVSSKLLPIDAKGYLVMPLSGTAPFSLVIKKGTAIAATFTLNEEEVEKATQNDAEKPDIYRVLYYQVVPEKKAIKSIPAPPRPADIVPEPILSSIKEVITIKEVSPVNETPPAPVVTAAPIVYAPLEPVKTKVMKGRALDKTGKPFKNTTFIIYAGNPSDGGTKDLKMQPLASGTTDSSGNFSIAMPNSEFLDAMAVLGIAPNIPIDIVLEKNKMPDFALLVLEKAETTTESGHEHDDDCACHDKLGRLPEMDDLLDPESKYQQDIGGSCVNFTTPNRALEEFSYFSVVRHTDPEVMNAPGYIENLKLKIKEIERTVANLKKPKSLTSEASSFILYDLMKLQKDAPDVQGGWDWSKLQSEINAILSMGELIGEAVNPRLFNIPAESYFGKGSNPKVFLGFVIQWHRNFLYSDPNAEIVTPPTSVAIADLGRIRNTVLATHNNVMWDYQALILNIFNTESFNATAIHVNEPISPQLFTWCNDWYNTWVNCGSLFKNVVDKFTTEQNRYLTQTPAPIRKPLGNGGQLPTSNVIRALAALKKRDSLSFTDIRATIDNLTKSLKMGNSKETLATRVKGFSEADYNNIGSDPNVLVNFLIQQQVKHLTGNRDWNAAQGTTNSIADRNSQNVDWLEIELERLQNELRYAEFNKNKAINRTGVGVNNRIQWDTHLPIVQPATIAHGHLLNFRQVWRADGYSMGDLLYSLPLAPGQQKQIVIRDWERKEVASRSEEQTVEEAIDSSLDTNRDINEIVSASLKEQSEGKSKATTSGMGGGMGYSAAASGSASVGGIPINARMGVSGGFSASYGKGKSESQQKSSRDTTASTMQKVRDSVMQHSSAMRSQRSTVVTTMTQSESSHITTESIANYNHCHAITIQYFEVLRHLAVYNELAGIQECLFIPLSMSLFDDSKIIRWIDLLLPALRAPRMKYADLQRGFEAVRRYHDVHILNKNEEEVYHNVPRGRYCDERITQINGNLRLAISIACPAKITNPITEELTKTLAALRDSGSLFASLMNNVIINQDDDQRNWQQTLGFIKEVEDIRQKVNKAEDDKREEVFQAELIRVNAIAQLARHLQMTVGNPNPNRVNARFSLTRSSSDRSNGQVPTFDFSFRTAADRLSIERDDIQTLGIGLNNNAVRLPVGSSITVERLTANYRSRYINARLVDSRPSEDLLAGAVNIYTPLDDSEMVSPRQEDVRLRNELIDHLNSNMEYYHKAIWVQMDEDRRYMLLEGFTIEVPPRENPAYAPGNGEPQFLSQREYRSVASVVENRLIGIAGNSIIMPVANGYNLNPVFRFADDEVEIEGRKISKLMAYYMPEKGFKDTPFRISIPTKGVFAEAVQGACNSCEKIDDSRYWKWEEHPIPNKPTEITPVGLENLRVAPENMMPSEMATAILKQQEGRNLPAPTGMDKAMELLGKTSTFNDITGLKGNQENAAAALKINSEAAQKYAEMAKDIAKSVEIPKNAAAYIDAVKRSGLPEKDQNELIKNYLAGEMGGTKTPSKEVDTEGTELTEEEVAMKLEAIDTAVQAILEELEEELEEFRTSLEGKEPSDVSESIVPPIPGAPQ